MRRICFIVLCLVLVACGPSPEQQIATQTVLVATSVAALAQTQTAMPTYTLPQTGTPDLNAAATQILALTQTKETSDKAAADIRST